MVSKKQYLIKMVALPKSKQCSLNYVDDQVPFETFDIETWREDELISQILIPNLSNSEKLYRQFKGKKSYFHFRAT